MVEVNSLIVSDEIDRYGSTVGIKVIPYTYSDHGDKNAGTATITTTVAVVNVLSSDSYEVKEGMYVPGDKKFFFKPTETISVGNFIIHSSKDYEVKEVVTHELEDTSYVKEVGCVKVS